MRRRDIVTLLGGRRYNPLTALGSDLLAWWDADPRYWGASGGITDVGSGKLSSWRDIVTGLDVTQGTDSARPVWSATSFNGGPGVTFDGSDDTLALTLAGQFPATANPSELWGLAQQDALAADATVRNLAGYGNAASNICRDIRRAVVTAVNRGRANTGDGAAAQSATGIAVDFSTRHVIRSQIGATVTTVTIDGTDIQSANIVPSTTATRFRIGASTAGTASLFWQGQIVAALVTLPLSVGKAAQLQTWMLSRRRL